MKYRFKLNMYHFSMKCINNRLNVFKFGSIPKSKFKMKNVFLMSKIMMTTVFFLLFFCSCNNEDVYVVEKEVVEEEVVEEENSEEEETPDDEDEDTPVDIENDEVILDEDTVATLNLFANDIEIPSSGVLVYTEPANGILSIDNNGTPDLVSDDILLYTPNEDFFGEDNFDYTICDAVNTENCDSAVVSITINPVEETFEDDIATELKAFPTAYGGGAYASGGRGGTVYHVTNLNDSGVGSLRWAIDEPRPAIVVFDVAGTIDLQNWLTINGKDLTIAGQTAPVGGITITSSNQSKIRGQDMSNVIIRHIRIRPTETPDDAFDMYGNREGAHDIIFDHISMSYGGDETLSLRGADTYNVTYQRCLIAEGKTGSLFGDSQTPRNSYDNSLLNCLYWNISHRIPNAASNGRVDIVNNVTQNWQYRLSYVTGDIELNHINNYYAMGERSRLSDGSQIQLNPLESFNDNKIYTAGNIIDKGMFTDPNADNKALWVEFELGQQTKYAPSSEFVNSQYSLVGAPVEIKTAEEAYREVVNNPDVGANASLNGDGTVTYFTDPNDTDYLNVMSRGEGAYEHYENYSNVRSWFGEQRYSNFVSSISSTPTNVRPTDYDTDGDGMPDVWEENNGYDKSVADGTEDRDGDGYTNLEEFLNLVDKKN